MASYILKRKAFSKEQEVYLSPEEEAAYMGVINEAANRERKIKRSRGAWRGAVLGTTAGTVYGLGSAFIPTIREATSGENPVELITEMVKGGKKLLKTPVYSAIGAGVGAGVGGYLGNRSGKKSGAAYARKQIRRIKDKDNEENK